MAKVTVNIEADSPADFHTALQALIGGAGAPAAEGLPETAAAAQEPAKPARNKKTADNKQPEPVAETPDAAPVPAVDPTPPAKEKPTQIARDDLRDAMQTLKTLITRQLVAEFSGKALEERPRLSDVPTEKYADMMTEAKRLSQLPENIKQDANE
ncbi:MAG: hypothetical protein P4N59_29465 [Negativicutes bacterium]|nr:hypothetical protein [Negativicutes bacterium]